MIGQTLDILQVFVVTDGLNVLLPWPQLNCNFNFNNASERQHETFKGLFTWREEGPITRKILEGEKQLFVCFTSRNFSLARDLYEVENKSKMVACHAGG